MFSRLAKLVALVAAVQLLGGHWMVLQAVAWAGMVVTYSQGSTLISAVEKTFDGKHPCKGCVVVKEGKEQEQKSAVEKTLVKWDAVLPVSVAMPVRSSVAMVYPPTVWRGAWLAAAPPVPPPLA